MSGPRVFVSYVQENRVLVAKLVNDLRSRGVNVWFDRDALPPGVFWRDEIRKAVSRHEYFLACFSAEYTGRERTYMNEELEFAIEEIRLRGTAPWFIPLVFSGDVPDRSIGPGRTLRDIQFVDFRDGEWPEVIGRLVNALTTSGSHAVIAVSTNVSSFSGKQQDATEPFELDAGLWHAELSHEGHGHFSAWLLDDGGDRVALLVSETGEFVGSKLIALQRVGTFVLDVSANGPWKIDLRRPAHSGVVTEVMGQRQAATPLVPFSRGLHKFRLSHEGHGHFSAWIYDSTGERLHLLANETGQFAGSKAVQLPRGELAFDVSASGRWSIMWQ